MKPIIGITCDYSYINAVNNLEAYGSIRMARICEDYYKGIEKAGGIPIIIPILDEENIDQLLNKLDGIVFSGGRDFDPKYYGENPISGLDGIIPQRDRWEMAIAKKSIEIGLPIFGICRGLQVINVVMGGTLYQDIYTQNEDRNLLKHRQLAPRWYGSHKVLIKEKTRLRDIFNDDEIYVNSFHHQAIKKLGSGLKVNAYSPDEIIEGIESINDKFILGVQWHPENMWSENKLFLNLFRALAEAGLEYKK